MKFRFHRGGLSESLATVVDIPDRQALARHVNEELRMTFEDMGLAELGADQLVIKPYCFDRRIGWDTYIVLAPGFGPIGFLDGPCPAAEA